MHKKHMFLRVFSKITTFACVFCTLSAWAETTTCDINFTPVTGNSWQNSTPTPTSPVEIESIGTKVGNKYAVQVAVNYDGGVVDLGTLNWRKDWWDTSGRLYAVLSNKQLGAKNVYSVIGPTVQEDNQLKYKKGICGSLEYHYIYVGDAKEHSSAQDFINSLKGVHAYYQRTTDETWTAPTLKTVYLDEPLRKVGDYADVLDYKNGQIIRNVGVKVFTGTENWEKSTGAPYSYWGITKNSIGTDSSVLPSRSENIISSHFPVGTSSDHNVIYVGNQYINFTQIGDIADTLDAWKTYIAQQYAAGTPVTVYYPLATPVVEQIENWSCTPPITEIKIATTKFVDEEFAAAEANLAATVQTIESVVSRTIAQTGQIQILQDTKQTRPDETCPANMKCLLVQDEDGTPHWYPIIEP